MKRASSWSLQLYSPYVALALFLILIITTIQYISLSSQQRSLMARGDHTQKERDLLEVSLVRNETSLGPPSLKRDPILGSNLRLRYLQSVPKNAQFFIEMKERSDFSCMSRYPTFFPLFPSTCDWLAASFLNPDWFTKLARHTLVPHSFSRQPKSLLSFLSMRNIAVSI